MSLKLSRTRWYFGLWGKVKHANQFDIVNIICYFDISTAVFLIWQLTCSGLMFKLIYPSCDKLDYLIMENVSWETMKLQRNINLALIWGDFKHNNWATIYKPDDVFQTLKDSLCIIEMKEKTDKWLDKFYFWTRFDCDAYQVW